MKPYILLTPGPLTTSPTVKEKMMVDYCTWDDDYNISIVQNIRDRLVALATKHTADYTSVLLQGSGTYAVEATITCSMSQKDKVLILTNGTYGDRMITICQYAKLNYEVLAFGEAEPLSLSELDSSLQKMNDITHVAFVHCETTSGILNPLEDLCLIAKKHNKTLIVDAMSSFGGIPFDIGSLGIDYMISSANKCIEGVPGFAFIIARHSELERCKGNSKSLSLDIYAQWKTMEDGNGKWRFTSPTHTVRAFKQALDELDAEGGIESRYKRYKENQQILAQGMKSLGYNILLPEDIQSPIISSFEYPDENFSFKDFYTKLKEQGFVIYPGKISGTDTFRIGSIGQIYPTDMKKLIEAISSL
ncbi:2-aminoethylphosphonate-pyruvate transaminase [Dysgonomonas hofstadii]|uniref:2-aminoethylphosphonate--pyruvate transaminase n=1 Tax=Dysgonomonas hofstadii TaxID=637886 RepID=A0A840CLA4_9BACT|nr:2-aminoethylphosphonate--pyruvate transaminase [Dysgonomonas hofstadii]MBB4034828.1 2-aminoethylphosphonate-pyruvate transaminase [Dysgonomonas hofstadii]